MDMRLGRIGNTKAGVPVYDRHNSHIHGDIVGLIKQIVETIENVVSFEPIAYRFNRVIGKTLCVKRKEGDQVIMMNRFRRRGSSPIVLNREPEDCNTLTIVLMEVDDVDLGKIYILLTAYIGEPAPPEPWDEKVKDIDYSIDFWSKHALIWER
jgi:hypothetical protein